MVAAYLKIDQFMSQFVNPKKRSFLLPEGCKDLIDVLNYRDCAKGSGAELGKIILQAFESDEQLRRKLAVTAKTPPFEIFIRAVLFHAQRLHATELVIGIPSAYRDTPIQYKVGDGWYDFAPIPSLIRNEVLAELAHMAHLPDGPFPKQGVVDVPLSGGVRLRWIVSVASADGLCTLARARD